MTQQQQHAWEEIKRIAGKNFPTLVTIAVLDEGKPYEFMDENLVMSIHGNHVTIGKAIQNAQRRHEAFYQTQLQHTISAATQKN